MSNINRQKMYTFTLNIGYTNGTREEALDITEELGIDLKDINKLSEEEFDNLMDKAWTEWAWNYIDGGYSPQEGT